MSDVSGIEISDVLGLSEPLTKLIETVGDGIGKLYEPIHIKRMAQAHGEEIKVIGEAISETGQLPIKFDNGLLKIDSIYIKELAERTKQRLIFQEMKKQNNIDHVVSYAAQELSNREKVSGVPVDKDWVTRFFDSVADVSTDDMQVIWGKILAGEVNEPGSFSLKTLDILRSISKKEAELFSAIVPLVVTTDGVCYITSDTDLLLKYGIHFSQLLTLDEFGLINSSGLQSYNLKISNTKTCVIFNKYRIAVLKGCSDDVVKISYGIYTLTSAGKELFNIMKCVPNNEYIIDFQKDIVKDNIGKVNISIHQVNDINSNSINYEDTPFLEINDKNC